MYQYYISQNYIFRFDGTSRLPAPGRAFLREIIYDQESILHFLHTYRSTTIIRYDNNYIFRSRNIKDRKQASKDEIHISTMNLRTFFCPELFLATAMLALDQQHQRLAVTGFELRQVVFSNTTKNRLMTPLCLDNAVLSSRRALAQNAADNNGTPSSPPPRGIVLNTAVGGLTFAGGIMGYVTKGSKASLIAGSFFGGLLMLSAFFISKSSESRSTKGNILGSSVSAMLGYVMGKKFLASKKFMPAGLLAFLSAVGFVYNLIEVKVLSAGGKDDDSSTPSNADPSETANDTESSNDV